MGLQLEFSPPISSVPSISPPPFQPVLALSISLWLHTISDEGRLEMLSNREDSCFLLTRRSSPSVTFPSSEIIPDPTSLQLCPIYKWSSSLVVSWGPVPELARLFTWQASLLPLSLALLFLSLVWLRFLTASASQTCCWVSSLRPGGCRHRYHGAFSCPRSHLLSCWTLRDKEKEYYKQIMVLLKYTQRQNLF